MDEVSFTKLAARSFTNEFSVKRLRKVDFGLNLRAALTPILPFMERTVPDEGTGMTKRDVTPAVLDEKNDAILSRFRIQLLVSPQPLIYTAQAPTTLPSQQKASSRRVLFSASPTNSFDPHTILCTITLAGPQGKTKRKSGGNAVLSWETQETTLLTGTVYRHLD